MKLYLNTQADMMNRSIMPRACGLVPFTTNPFVVRIISKADLCYSSEKWNTVSTEGRDQCLNVRNDGEFWLNNDKSSN